MNEENQNQQVPEAKDILAQSAKNFGQKQKSKIARGTDEFFTGYEGSVFSMGRRAITFVKESIQSINEAMKLRRAEKDIDNEGDDY